MFTLYLNALFKRPKLAVLTQFRQPALPARIHSKTLTLNSRHYSRYCELVGWKDETHIHPCYLQVATLALQLQCLADKDSPFAPVGLVHLTNHIQIYDHYSLDAPFECRVRFCEISAHRQGWIIYLSLEAFQHGKLVYRALSGYLSRVKAVHVAPGHKQTSSQPIDRGGFEPVTTLRIDASIARSYARVSGDYNPIHLHQLGARLFGFKTSIAHGMWSLASSISQLVESHQCAFSASSFVVDCEFKRPVFLPGQAELLAKQEPTSTSAILESAGKQHLWLHVNNLNSE